MPIATPPRDQPRSAEPAAGFRALSAWLAPLILFFANAWIAWPLFTLDYSRYMGSIEGAHLALVRYWRTSFPDYGWFPLWAGGIPFENTYPPVLHSLSALTAAISGWSDARAFHAVEWVFYVLGPLAVYWLCRRLGMTTTAAFAAGAVYSVLSPTGFVAESIRQTVGVPWNPRRLHTLVAFGDGPHVVALALLPLALVALDRALERTSMFRWLAASVAVAGVVLTNWLGAAALAIAVYCYLWTHPGTGRSLWARAAAIGLLAYGLAAPWLTLSTVTTIRSNSETVEGYYPTGWPQTWAMLGLLAAIAVLAVMLRRLRPPLEGRGSSPRGAWFALTFLLGTAPIALLWEWTGFYIVPQPHRYAAEFELAFALAAGALLGWLASRLPGRFRIAALVPLAAIAAGLAVHDYRFAREQIVPLEIHQTIEYRVAQWLGAHMPARRVMAPGSISFWLNAFSPTPQLGTGVDQGTVNWQNRVARYAILSGENAGAEDAAISILWLKAMGCHAVVAGGPGSREYYHAFRNGRKFDGVLEKIWLEGDDAIYRVPQRTASLARVIPPAAAVAQAPAHGLDVREIERYVAALEDPGLPPASLQWLSSDRALITGLFQPGQLISVQVSYAPGWKALVRGRPVGLRADGLGQLLIRPACDGPCAIDLIYDGGWQAGLAYVLRGLAIAVFVVWGLFAWRRRRRLSAKASPASQRTAS